MDSDGSEWTVNPDPEMVMGLVNNMFTLDKLNDKYQNLHDRFADEQIYLEVINVILNIDTNRPIRDLNKACHCTSQYIIENDKLWRIYGGTSVQPRSCVECITKTEAETKVELLHNTGGHWGRDALKIALTDKYHSPKLDVSIMKAIQNCGGCKNFGTPKLHALLEPITR